MNTEEENWGYCVNLNEIDKMHYDNFEVHVNSLSDDILKLLEDSSLENNIGQVSTGQSYDEELKELQVKNKQLRQEMDTKLYELSQKQTQYESYKRDQKLLSQEIKETHEAFLAARKYYKTYLNMYYTIESRTDNQQVIFVQFFTEAKKDSENYSIRLTRDCKTKQYELVSTTPKLDMLKEFQQILLQTNDVVGALYSIREEFITLKQSKK